MTMYLLLRNNKQSGPYSLEELKNMGLKAYDLIWSEGKSAAWRYPCELAELSAFAPAVEEQPFDRFFKKPSATTATSTQTMVLAPASAQTMAAATVELRPASPIESPVDAPVAEPVKIPGKRIIYVTMPAGRTPTPFRETVPPPVTAAPASTTIVPSSVLATPARQVVAIPDYAAEPMDQTLSSLRRSSGRRSQNSRQLIRFMVIGAGILVLLAAGIFIGLSLNKSSLGIQQKVVARNPPTETAQAIVHPTAQQMPAPAVIPPAGRQKTADSTVAIENKPVDMHASRLNAKTNKNRTAVARQKESSLHALTLTRLAPVGKDATTDSAGHREAVHRSDIPDEPHPDNSAMRATLANQVSVGANSYSVGAFGGINNLQLTVTNRSAYPLDLVIVELQYIQANKKVFKTESLYFRSIGAGSALMQEAPRSSRGVKVQYKITTINSREVGLSYSGL